MSDDDTITISRRTARLLGALGLVVAGAVTPALVGGNTDAPAPFPPIPGLTAGGGQQDKESAKRMARIEKELGIDLDPIEAVAELRRDVATLKGEIRRLGDESKHLTIRIEEMQKTSIDATRLAPLLDSLESVAADMARAVGRTNKEYP